MLTFQLKQKNDVYFDNPDHIQMFKSLKFLNAQTIFMPQLIVQILSVNRLS